MGCCTCGDDPYARSERRFKDHMSAEEVSVLEQMDDFAPLAKLRRLFHTVDDDGHGSIHAEDAAVALRLRDDAWGRAMRDFLEPDREGARLNLGDFIVAVARFKHPSLCDGRTQFAFALLDMGAGFVTAKRLAETIRAHAKKKYGGREGTHLSAKAGMEALRRFEEDVANCEELGMREFYYDDFEAIFLKHNELFSDAVWCWEKCVEPCAIAARAVCEKMRARGLREWNLDYNNFTRVMARRRRRNGVQKGAFQTIGSQARRPDVRAGAPGAPGAPTSSPLPGALNADANADDAKRTGTERENLVASVLFGADAQALVVANRRREKEAAARKESSVSDDTLAHVSRYREEKVREARERREARGASGVMGRAREAWALVTKTTKKLLKMRPPKDEKTDEDVDGWVNETVRESGRHSKRLGGGRYDAPYHGGGGGGGDDEWIGRGERRRAKKTGGLASFGKSVKKLFAGGRSKKKLAAEAAEERDWDHVPVRRGRGNRPRGRASHQ